MEAEWTLKLRIRSVSYTHLDVYKRQDISNGRYETQGGHTLTSYFLGKVCLARNLEPKIPEESLVIQLGYHYEETIQKARRQGQIKTIQGMVSLLEDMEKDN